MSCYLVDIHGYDLQEEIKVRCRVNVLAIRNEVGYPSAIVHASVSRGGLHGERRHESHRDIGGATQPSDMIYQIIAVPEELTLWLKAPNNFDWQKVDLNGLFAGKGT